jgi:hypothetical protein
VNLFGENEAAEPDLTLEQFQHLMAARREMRELGYGLISLRELMGEIADETGPEFVLPAVATSDDRRRDYGPQGACAPKAALLLAIPFLLLRFLWKARRS